MFSAFLRRSINPFTEWTEPKFDSSNSLHCDALHMCIHGNDNLDLLHSKYVQDKVKSISRKMSSCSTLLKLWLPMVSETAIDNLFIPRNKNVVLLTLKCKKSYPDCSDEAIARYVRLHHNGHVQIVKCADTIFKVIKGCSSQAIVGNQTSLHSIEDCIRNTQTILQKHYSGSYSTAACKLRKMLEDLDVAPFVISMLSLSSEDRQHLQPAFWSSIAQANIHLGVDRFLPAWDSRNSTHVYLVRILRYGKTAVRQIEVENTTIESTVSIFRKVAHLYSCWFPSHNIRNFKRIVAVQSSFERFSARVATLPFASNQKLVAALCKPYKNRRRWLCLQIEILLVELFQDGIAAHDDAYQVYARNFVEAVQQHCSKQSSILQYLVIARRILSKCGQSKLLQGAISETRTLLAQEKK